MKPTLHPMGVTTLMLGVAATLAATSCSDSVADDATTTTPTTAVPPTTTAQPTTETSAPSGSAAPFELTPAGGEYTVTFPGEPSPVEQELALPDGTKVPYTLYAYSDQTAGAPRDLAAALIEYPAGTSVDLVGARDGIVASFAGATLGSSEEIELQGRQGLEFAVDLGAEGARYLSRIYVDDARLYQLVYVSNDVSLDDAEVTAFFDSFQFPEGG